MHQEKHMQDLASGEEWEVNEMEYEDDPNDLTVLTPMSARKTGW